jgi:hypothetical protein
MQTPDRRAFLASAGALSLFPLSGSPATAQTCVTSGLPAFMPRRLTVDCATRLNFANYRKNAAYQGLVGCVSMTYIRGRFGEYPAGNLFLFPWLNAAGMKLGAAKDWQAVMPLGLAQSAPAAPIRGWTAPLDDYFCRYVVEAPPASFIGFRIDTPFPGKDSPTRPWRTNVSKLSDGAPVGIEWTSANLNRPWFGGSPWIPATSDCHGSAWRTVIIDGLKQASVGHC